MQGDSVPRSVPLRPSPSRLAALALPEHHDHHHDDGDQIGSHGGEIAGDIVLQAQAQRVDEAEEQGGQKYDEGIAPAEDDAGKGHVATGGGHVLGEHGQIAKGQMRARHTGQNTADHAGEAFHFLGAFAAGGEGIGILAGGPQMHAHGGLVDESPQDQHQGPAHVHQQGVPGEQLPQHGNVPDQGQVDGGQGHQRGIGECALDLKHGAQKEYRQAAREDVQGNADDELIAAELDDEYIVEQAQQNAAEDGQTQSGDPAAEEIAAQHRKERADEHHAVDTDVGHVHMLGHQAAHGRQHHGSGGTQGGL